MSSSTRGRRKSTLLAVALAAASMTIVACGDDEGGGGGGGGGGGDYKMTLIAGVKGDEFYITMNCGAQAEAQKQNVELDVVLLRLGLRAAVHGDVELVALDAGDQRHLVAIAAATGG